MLNSKRIPYEVRLFIGKPSGRLTGPFGREKKKKENQAAEIDQITTVDHSFGKPAVMKLHPDLLQIVVRTGLKDR